MAMNPIQSYKQVTVDGPASRAAATIIIHDVLLGVDNYTGPGASNSEVPTGAKVMSFLLMATYSNLVAVSSLMHFHVQFRRSGTAVVTPGVVGGNPLRNTVTTTRMFFIGKEQNTTMVILVKVPRIYQRIREGDIWSILYSSDTVFASATQAIYKFYR